VRHDDSPGVRHCSHPPRVISALRAASTTTALSNSRAPRHPGQLAQSRKPPSARRGRGRRPHPDRRHRSGTPSPPPRRRPRQRHPDLFAPWRLGARQSDASTTTALSNSRAPRHPGQLARSRQAAKRSARARSSPTSRPSASERDAQPSSASPPTSETPRPLRALAPWRETKRRLDHHRPLEQSSAATPRTARAEPPSRQALSSDAHVGDAQTLGPDPSLLPDERPEGAPRSIGHRQGTQRPLPLHPRRPPRERREHLVPHPAEGIRRDPQPRPGVHEGQVRPRLGLTAHQIGDDLPADLPQGDAVAAVAEAVDDVLVAPGHSEGRAAAERDAEGTLSNCV
jgi:hypothetical protein